jgi:hypothetical protein
MTGLLQLGWYVDFVPPWLAPTIILTGLLIVAAHAYASIFNALDLDSVGVSGYATNATAALFLGTAFAGVVGVAPWYLAGNWVLIGLLGFLGQWIQGIAAVRFLQKVWIFVSERRLAGSGLPKRLGYFLIVYFVIALLVWGVIVAFVFTETLDSVTYSVTLVWTLVVFVTSLAGLVWRLKGARKSMSTPLLVGFVLMIAGAAIQNLSLLAEINVFLLGTAGYWGGYLVAVAVWVRH